MKGRLKRFRNSETLRNLFRETRVDVSNLVSPIFVRHGNGIAEQINSMPEVYRYSLDKAIEYIGKLNELGIKAILVFGIPGMKDEVGSEAYSSDGIVPAAIREIKKEFPSMVAIADVCMCGYTSHGHCGIIRNGRIDNDGTLQLLSQAAVQYAIAGADVLAPSAMMDGQVRAIRDALDEAGYEDRLVMGYSAKYASSFYGPFREAAASSPTFGDRKGYQMDISNSREAMREIVQDIREGADVVMVKPALAYLDIIAKARSKFDLPLAAYSVSGEYAMLKAATMNGWLDEKKGVYEILTAIKRAGADIIVTYYAEKFAQWIKEGN
jgi:porphobilinogen synthase